MSCSLVRLNTVILLLVLFNTGVEAGLINIFAGVVNMVSKVLTNFAPSSETVSYATNMVIGYPLTAVASVVDKICKCFAKKNIPRITTIHLLSQVPQGLQLKGICYGVKST